MDPSIKLPGSPGTPLFQVSPERVNQQRPQSMYEPASPAASIHSLSESRSRHVRESSVHDKVAQFNSLAFQGKQLERKANDAALKRAMVGREEAETEMRRYREENRVLRRQVEETKKDNMKVAERLETLMEHFEKTKESLMMKKTAAEKETKRLRNEAFKTESRFLKLREEVKVSRNATRVAQADYEQEKKRSATREQEAFAARYQIVGVQEELSRALEKIKLVEQERDALRTIAKNEEVARIAAEGRIPLPKSPDDDEFASPRKARMSLDPCTIISSAASEAELDDMRMLLEWEQQRAKRAHDRVEFLETECRLNCCASRASRDLLLATAPVSEVEPGMQKNLVVEPKTIFIPAEGVFRTVSPLPEESPWISPAKKSAPTYEEPSRPLSYARTPSCEPPGSAIISESNTSLLSLLDAPHSPTHSIKEDPEPEDDELETPSLITEARQEAEDDNEDTVIGTYKTISTTTTIPLATTPQKPPPTVSTHLAVTPTCSREEALAMIRERRGRARSLAQGTLTPRKQMVEGGVRRDISAPAIRSANTPASRGRSQIRAV